jgi:hypothetical protein
MQITRSTTDTARGPANPFTGDQQTDETGSPVTWGRHVTDEEYAEAPRPDA